MHHLSRRHIGRVLLVVVLAWLVAALPVVVAPAGASLPPVAELTVHVTDEGVPVEGASVSVDLFAPDTDEVWWSGGGTTGPDGSVAIVMPPGSYEVTARHEGTGHRASTRGFLAPASTDEITLALLPASAFGALVVEVLDGLGVPIPGIPVGLGDSNPPDPLGETGGVRFVLVDGVSAPPQGPPTLLQAVGGEGTIELSWAPPAASPDPAALPVTGYVVTLDDSPVAMVAADVTDHLLEGVAPGGHEVGVVAVDLLGGGAPATASVTVAEPSTADDVTFEMHFDGAPLLGGIVALVGDGGTVAHGATDLQGHVSFTDLPTGSYEVWASAPGWDGIDDGASWLVFPGVAAQTVTALPTARTHPASGRVLDIPHALAVDVVPIDMRTYPDVPPEHPFFQEIRAVANAGLAFGSPQGFQPVAPMSRQAVAAWLARRADVELEPCTAAPFSDVPTDHPFCSEISWLATSGATEGYADGTFRPTSPVTRQTAAAFLWRLAGEPPVGPGPPSFADVGVDHPFRAAIEWMAASGRSSGYGDGTFRPATVVSRQAMAVFLYPDVRPAALDPDDAPAL